MDEMAPGCPRRSPHDAHADGAGADAVGGRGDANRARLTGRRADDRERKTVERLARWRHERFEARRIAVVGGHDSSGTADGEGDAVVRTRHGESAAVLD